MSDANIQNNPRAAALSMIGAMAIIGTIDNFIAVIARDIGLWQFQILRAALALPMLWGAVLLGFGQMLPKNWMAVFVRSALLATAMVFYFGALAFLPISQALAGLLTAPIFVVVITALFRGVSVGPTRYAAVIIGFAGTMLVLDVSPMALEWTVIMPVIGGVFYALAAIVTRDYCQDESPIAMLAMLMVFQMIIGAVALAVLVQMDPMVPAGRDGFLVRGWIWDLAQVWPFLLIQAAGSLIGVGLIIRAYQQGEASYVAIIEYCVFVFGPGAAWIMFGDTITLIQGVGIVMIVAAGGLIVRRI